MKVFLTVDTELWPLDQNWSPAPVADRGNELRREETMYFGGVTERGDFGIEYQLQCLARHGLKSTWFVETLFSELAGKDMLTRVVGRVRAHGQEVALHLHPEWLGRTAVPGLPGKSQCRIADYSVDEQVSLLRWGLDRLAECGAPAVTAFRAGSFGAGYSTLKALRRVGIPCDSSFNPVLAESFPEITQGRWDLLAPEIAEDVLMVPMSHFSTFTERARPAQLCACSAAEIEQALEAAHRSGWPCFVILWHSGELVRRSTPNEPYVTHVKRFERLCRFLGENRERYTTSHFAELLPIGSVKGPAAPISVGPSATVRRVLEQAVSRTARLEQMLAS